MRRYAGAAGLLTATLLLAPAALGAAAGEGWNPQVAKSQPPEPEAPLPAVKLNPTGRDYEIDVPLMLDKARLGDVGIKITADDKVFADARLLKTYLGKVYLPEILTAALAAPGDQAAQMADSSVVGKKTSGAASSMVQPASLRAEGKEPGALGKEKPSYISLATLKERGIDLRYNPQGLDLEVYPTVDQRPTSTFSLGINNEVVSEAMETPAYVSAYLNMRLTASYVSQATIGNTGFLAPSIDFDGAVRIGPAVLEGEGTFFSGSGTAFTQTSYQDYVFYRRGTRLVYDWPDEAIRFRLGDITPQYSGFQTVPDLLGLSVDVAYAQLQPMKSIRPTGNHSFRIERPSNVDIIVDTVMARRIRLGPGTYNLTDLPLNPGAHDVKLVITDDLGAQQTLEFKDFSGQQLLAPGITEWSFNAGVKSYDTGVVTSTFSQTLPSLANTTLVNKKSSFYAQREYFFDQPAVTAFYRTGILNWLTADANVQADSYVAMAGAGYATQTIAGYFLGEFAGSDAYSGGPGFAIRLGYGFDKFDWFNGYASTFRLIGEYRSHDFETVETNGALTNNNSYVAATFSQQVPWDITTGLSFSYYFADHSSQYDTGDRWEADVSFSKQIWDGLSGSLSVGYGRDQAAPNCCSLGQTSITPVYNQNGFQAYVRLAWTPDPHSNAFATYDSRSQTAQATYTQSSETSGVGSWTATATADTQANGESSVSATATYAANRADVYVSHAAGFQRPRLHGSFQPGEHGGGHLDWRRHELRLRGWRLGHGPPRDQRRLCARHAA